MNTQKRTLKVLVGFFYRSRRALLLIIAVAAITVIFDTLIAVWLSRSYDLRIPSLGTIHVTGVEAYGGDINSTGNGLTVDWGEILLGRSYNVSFYLRSLSNVPITLALNLDDWTPQDIEPFMFVSWNYTGTEIAPGEEIPIRIDLETKTTPAFVDYLLVNHVTSFSFSLIIYIIQS